MSDPDYKRVLTFLKNNPGWHTVVVIAEKCGCQHNSTQRSLNHNLREEPIERRRVEGSNCKEYSYEAHGGGRESSKDYIQLNTRCDCGASWWAVNGRCNRCGANRQDAIRFSRRFLKSTPWVRA